jgi:hypothetical protein
MALRICLVTPFAWSRPHEVNEHVAGVAQELRVLGHAVTIVTSSNRAADLATGRLALVNGSVEESELVVLGPAVPISRRSRIGVPSACARTSRARCAPVASTSSTVSSRRCRASRTLRARGREPDRGDVPLARAARVSAGPRAAREAARQDRRAARDVRGERPRRPRSLPGDYRIVSEGVDTSLFEPRPRSRS